MNTSIADGSGLLTTYKVRSGDSLTGIANRFGVSMATVMWANNLKTAVAVHTGQVLTIPPVNGVVLSVHEGDTLASIAASYSVPADKIYKLNGLQDTALVVGQTLILPGAVEAARPPQRQSKPVLRIPRSAPASGRTVGTTPGPVRPPAHYGGGKFAWPVVGGNNYISQYFHAGHYAIDIAADYGARVVAAADGIVTFAGWKNNGGGYQVWIAHGSGLFTTYNHMSAITVGTGQSRHPRAAGRPGRPVRQRHRAPLPLRGLARARSGTAAPGSTRSPTSRPRRTARPGARRPLPCSGGRAAHPCDNRGDVPRPREDLGPRR